jgi:hypothetical protein
MDAPGKPFCFAVLKKEIAFARMKLTPQRRMDELELLTELVNNDADFSTESAPGTVMPFRPESGLQSE